MKGGDVHYTTHGIGGTRRPDHGSGRLSSVAARQLYENHEDLNIIDAADADPHGTLRPRWTIELTGPDARVQLFDRHGALWRRVDHTEIDGRLWRRSTCDYTYPDDTKRWEQTEIMLEVQSVIHPDGTGSLTILDRTECRPGTWLVSRYSGRAVNDYWIDRPAFGDWGALNNPGASAYEVAGSEAAARAS